MLKRTKIFFIFIAIITPIIVSLLYHSTQQEKINYYQGHRYFIRGDFKRAIPFLMKSLEYDSDYILPEKELAHSYLWTEEPAKSIPLFLNILSKEPENNEIKLSLADAYAWTGNYSEAISLIREVISQNNSLAAKIKLAEVYLWSGEGSIELIKKEIPNLILLDLRLPKVNGDEICLNLKADSKISSIPVILITASSNSIAEVTKKCRADDYCLKPFNPEELIAKIKKYV